MKLSASSKLSHQSRLLKASGLAALLFSNLVLAESYQSFSAINYSHNEYSLKEPEYNYYSKGDRNQLALYSQYFFEEQQSLGPLNEFDYINTSSNVFSSVNYSQGEYFSSYNDYSSEADSSNSSIGFGGEWVVSNFILGASYSYNYYKSKVDYSERSYDDSNNDISLSIGYLFSDNFMIKAGYIDDVNGSGDDSFSYSASYNLPLEGTDYIGLSYSVDDDFDIHQASTKYFFGFAEESYLVLGGSYIYDNSDSRFSEDYWSVNARYYYNEKTSISVTYDEGDYYSINTSYFIDNNYSVQLGYNSVANDKEEHDSDGYYLSVTAQF